MTLLPNSKKCLILSLFLSGVSLGQAALGSEIRANVVDDLNKYSGSRFEDLLKKWQDSYGTAAVTPLFQVAGDSKIADSKRYIALMGAAKLSGKASRPIVEKFSKDKSWMLRVASLKALTLLQAKESSTVLITALNDPALLVRSAAVDAIQSLNLKEAKPALSKALKSKENYTRDHKPLFICPQIEKALSAL